MICQQCMQKPANVQITQVVNNQKKVLYLCESCAGARQDLITELPFNMSSLLASIMGNMHGYTQLPVQEKIGDCNVCGLTYEEFSTTGKLGCWNCYNKFGVRLAPIFRRLHGNMKHTGKVPKKANNERKTVKEIHSLKSLLEEAIRNEEYEKAAQIRDRIKHLENEQKKAGGVK